MRGAQRIARAIPGVRLGVSEGQGSRPAHRMNMGRIGQLKSSETKDACLAASTRCASSCISSVFHNENKASNSSPRLTQPRVRSKALGGLRYALQCASIKLNILDLVAESCPILAIKCGSEIEQDINEIEATMTKIITDGVVVSPAYGRDYNNSADAKKAFLDGKDFVCESFIPEHSGAQGRYCSVRDFTEGCMVEVRYARKEKLVNVVVGGAK